MDKPEVSLIGKSTPNCIEWRLQKSMISNFSVDNFSTIFCRFYQKKLSLQTRVYCILLQNISIVGKVITDSDSP